MPLVSSVVHPDGSVHPNLLPPEGMVALAWAVNVKPETVALIAGVTAQARSLTAAVEQVALDASQALVALDEQLRDQDLPDELFALALARVGSGELVRLLDNMSDALADAVLPASGDVLAEARR